MGQFLQDGQQLDRLVQQQDRLVQQQNSGLLRWRWPSLIGAGRR